MTTEEVRNEAETLISELETNYQHLTDKISSLSCGEGSVGDLDDIYKQVKEKAKSLKRLAVQYRKLTDGEGA